MTSVCQECVVTSCALDLCVGLTFKHFENGNETKINFNTHCTCPLYFWCCLLSGHCTSEWWSWGLSGPQSMKFSPHTDHIGHLHGASLCWPHEGHFVFACKAGGRPSHLAGPADRDLHRWGWKCRSGQNAAFADAHKLEEKISSKVKFCVWCLLYTVDYVKLPSPASSALILFRPLNKI